MSEKTTLRVTAQTHYDHPPKWAVLERQLIAAMNQSVEPLLEKYVHPNGEIMWPVSEDFQSIDGLDDAYESFHNWPSRQFIRSLTCCCMTWEMGLPTGVRTSWLEGANGVRRLYGVSACPRP